MGSTWASWAGRCIEEMNCSYVVPARTKQFHFNSALNALLHSVGATRASLSWCATGLCQANKSLRWAKHFPVSRCHMIAPTLT